jgi:hypothetical protein
MAGSAEDPPAAPDTETVLSGLWHEVLGRQPDHDADFFDLGGDSMRAARLTSQVKRVLSKGVRMRVVFDNPRFADYVKAVDELRASG